MNFQSKNIFSFGLATQIWGAVFTGFCIFYDMRRTHHPDCKKKIRYDRFNKKYANLKHPNSNINNKLQKYWGREIFLGEQLCRRNQYADGAKHFINAVVLCPLECHILKVLHCSITQRSFEEMVMQLFKSQPTFKMNESLPERLKLIRKDILECLLSKSDQVDFEKTAINGMNYNYIEEHIVYDKNEISRSSDVSK